MKKLLAVILSVVLVLSCFAFTACSCAHEYSPKTGLCNKCGEACVHDFNEKGRCNICNGKCAHANHDQMTRICNDCGIQTWHEMKDFKCVECGRETIFYYENLPAKYTEPTDKKGQVFEFKYDTYAYAVEGLAGLELGTLAIEKTANVYLPYGYDPNKQYNVMYLMHGSGENYNTWFGIGPLNDNDHKAVDNVPMIDQVFALAEVEPFIIVTPSFYSHVPEDSEYAKYNNAEEIGNYEVSHFRYEMRDLVKAFESQYSTYANGDVSDENLIATRNHRAYAGLSKGARTSFASIVTGCLDIIGYVGSFSGSGVNYTDGPEESVEWIKKALNEDFKGYDLLYWYHGDGSDDMALEDHDVVYNTLIKELPDKLKEGVNMEFVVKEDHEHAMDNWHIDLWNVLHVFFTKG